MGVDVMAKLRGEVKDSDPTASPSRRLGALMRSADGVDAAASRETAAIDSSGSAVTRSPKQVRERAGELQHEVECDEVKMAEVVRGLGPDLVARHGVRGAAERIAQLYDTLSVLIEHKVTTRLSLSFSFSFSFSLLSSFSFSPCFHNCGFFVLVCICFVLLSVGGCPWQRQ